MYHSNITSHFGTRSSTASTDYGRTEPISPRAAMLLISGLSFALWGALAVIVSHFL